MLRALLAIAVVVAGATASPAGPVAIVGVVPNPIAPGDRGEHVVLRFPVETDVSGWSLADGESVARFPNRTVVGRVVATTDPGALPDVARGRVLRLRGRLALSNGGETVSLRDGAVTIDRRRYGDAPEGSIYESTDGGWRWRPLGATDYPLLAVEDVPVRAFVLPDAPAAPLDALASARRRLLLAGYTLTSKRVVRALCGATARGVRVRVLLEASPVGGISRGEARRLDALAACGVPVRVLGGEADRYAFHHAKYAVVDDRAVVLSENWKPSGVGGRSSRGWGVVLDSPAIADRLGAVFEADATYRDATRWRTFRSGRRFHADDAATGRYPARFEPASTTAKRVEVVLAPDNAESAGIDLLRSARESIRVQQLSIGDRRHPYVRALVRSARRGVRVRVLLSGAWYVREENEATAAWLNRLADREGLDLSARVADPAGRFEKIHVKGAIVDGERVLVGSINWTNGSVRENREVAVVLHGRAVGRYYTRVFEADWRGGTARIPVGMLAVVGAAIALGVLRFRRRYRFER